MATKRSKHAGNRSASSRPSRREAEPAAPAPRPWQRVSLNVLHPDPAFPNVPLRWLLRALALTLLVVIACAWLLFCFLFWQGSWQLLYHPSRVVQATPSDKHLPYQWIHFDASETGITQLTAWWIPSDDSLPRSAILVLHGADGNLSDTLPLDAWLHSQHQSIFVLDYRGYGKSASGRPSDAQLTADATRAVRWLVDTKHIPRGAIIVWGTGLGAEIATRLATDSSEIAGGVLEDPIEHPLDRILNDPRSHLVPAHLLLRDHYDLTRDASRIAVPSLWLLPQSSPRPQAYNQVSAPKTAVWLRMPLAQDPDSADAFNRWLDGLPSIAATR